MQNPHQPPDYIEIESSETVLQTYTLDGMYRLELDSDIPHHFVAVDRGYLWMPMVPYVLSMQ